MLECAPLKGRPLSPDRQYCTSPFVVDVWEQNDEAHPHPRISRKLLKDDCDVIGGVNRRLASSFLIWFVSYYFMAVFGGSVAFYRFPREPTTDPEPYTLKDVGFQLLPEFCPRIILGLNPQSAVLAFFYLYALFWALHHRRDRGALLVTRILLISSMVFVTRTSVVGLTALPQPNFASHCSLSQTHTVTFWQAVKEVCGVFPPKACGDLIYSGHVACAFITLFAFDSVRAFPPSPPSIPFLSRLLFYSLGGVVAVSCLLCRSHYTVDVLLGVYFSYFLSVYYLQRAEGVVGGGWMGKLIRYLEKGQNYSGDQDHTSSSLGVETPLLSQESSPPDGASTCSPRTVAKGNTSYQSLASLSVGTYLFCEAASK